MVLVTVADAEGATVRGCPFDELPGQIKFRAFDLPQIAGAKGGRFFLEMLAPLVQRKAPIMQDWKPIATAPRDVDLHLGVIERGEVYALAFPCRRKGSQWVHATTGRPVDVDPTHWREWTD